MRIMITNSNNNSKNFNYHKLKQQHPKISKIISKIISTLFGYNFNLFGYNFVVCDRERPLPSSIGFVSASEFMWLLYMFLFFKRKSAKFAGCWL